MYRVDCSKLSRDELNVRMGKIRALQALARQDRDQFMETSADPHYFVDRCEHFALLAEDVAIEIDQRMHNREVVADAACAAVRAIHLVIREAGVSITEIGVMNLIGEYITTAVEQIVNRPRVERVVLRF